MRIAVISHQRRKRMVSFGLVFVFIVLLLQCEIASVVASASTSMASFGNNIAKHRNNITEDIPVFQNNIVDVSTSSSKEKNVPASKNIPTDSLRPKHQPSILLDESKRRIWCFGPGAASKVKNQRYYLPVRFLSILRNKDMIILPGNHQPTREFVDFVIPLLGLSHDQIIWTAGKSIDIDSDINSELQNHIREIILNSGIVLAESKGNNWVLVPYCVTKSFHDWSSALCEMFSIPELSGHIVSSDLNEKQISASKPTLEVFGETEEWNEKYGHKGILHRHIADLSLTSVIEDIDREYAVSNGDLGSDSRGKDLSSITTVPKGYQCSTVEHLLEAYKLLKKETFDNRAVIKPITGCAGWGIIFIDSVEELLSYDFPMGEVLLEEMLNLDLTEDGHVISPAVHYLGTELFGGQLVDQLMKNTTYLGWRESKAPPMFQKKVLDMTEKLLRFTQPKGPGGYDFLSVNGEPVLSDVNTGRFNGAHQPKLFLSQYAPEGSMWYCWKHKPSVSVSVSDVWRALSEAGLAFHPTDNMGGIGGVGGSENSSNNGSSRRVGSVGNGSGKGSRTGGVFPLTYLRGIDGIFIAIADTTERAYQIYERAAELLDQLENRQPAI